MTRNQGTTITNNLIDAKEERGSHDRGMACPGPPEIQKRFEAGPEVSIFHFSVAISSRSLKRLTAVKYTVGDRQVGQGLSCLRFAIWRAGAAPSLSLLRATVLWVLYKGPLEFAEVRVLESRTRMCQVQQDVLEGGSSRTGLLNNDVSAVSKYVSLQNDCMLHTGVLSPLMLAASAGCSEICRILLTGARRSIRPCERLKM